MRTPALDSIARDLRRRQRDAEYVSEWIRLGRECAAKGLSENETRVRATEEGAMPNDLESTLNAYRVAKKRI